MPISPNHADAVASPLDDQTELLIDDRSGNVPGCTIHDFRALYLRALPAWQLRPREAGLHRAFKRDVAMQRIEPLDVTWPVWLFDRSRHRIARVITAHAAYVPLAVNAIPASAVPHQSRNPS